MSLTINKKLTLEKKALHNKNEDFDLWLKVKDGDESAFEQFYLVHLNMLYNYGMKLCKDQGLVQDCIQDLFITIWQTKGNLTLTSSVKYYLLQALRRLIFRKLDQKKNLVLDESAFLGSNLRLVDDKEVFLDQPNPKLKSIKQAIGFLPKRQREALFLKYYENFDYEEIASIMSIQVSAVYKLVSAGIKKLRSGAK